MIEDGVYFQLEESAYHALPALSASGIKNLLISNPDFWFRSPYNPRRTDENTEAMCIGKAFHKRILEGRDLFYQHYAMEFQPPADCIKTNDELKDAIAALGEERPKGSPVKAKLIEQLLALNPHALIFENLKADYEQIHAGKEFLSAGLIESIEISATMIERDPEISKCFRGGYPEVSIIWTEEGVRMKARIDYLKPKTIVDLKTFGNPLSKPIDAAIYSAMATGKYHVQASFYDRAIQAAKELRLPWFGEVDAQWKEEFLAASEHVFRFVFQQKGIAPLARCKKFPREGAFQSGVMAIEKAIQIYKSCMEHYGPDIPWLDEAEIDEFSDALFPVWMSEL